MPFPRPTLAAFRSNVRQAFAARFPSADLTKANSVIGVLCDLFAATSYSEFGYLDYMALNLLPDTANADFLARWATIFGISRNAAQFAAGNAIFSGSAGSDVPAGTQVQAANGQTYTTQADLVLDVTGAGTTAIEADVAGAAANQAASAPLVMLSSLSGVVGTATVFDAGGATGGVDSETDDALRIRVLLRIQNPPQGGAAEDYLEWALAVPLIGVTRAWVYPLGITGTALGQVGIAFVCDGRGSVANPGAIIPTTGDVAAVAAYIAPLRPVTAQVSVFAPVPVVTNFTVSISPNNATIQAAVKQALYDLFARASAPGGIIYASQIVDAIMQSAGIVHCSVSSPAGDISMTAPVNMAILGTVTFA